MCSPSLTWFFTFKILSKTFTLTDIKNYQQFLKTTALNAFKQLQDNKELKSILSVSVLLTHYFINRIEHLITSLELFATSKFSILIEKQPPLYDIKTCSCIVCKFPDISSAFILDTNLINFFQELQRKTFATRMFTLAIFEKIYEIQCIHTTIINQLYPQMNSNDVLQYVTINC